MGSIEQNHSEYKRDGFNTIEPAVNAGIYRTGPRPAAFGIIQGGQSLCSEYKGFTDNDHCRIVFVPKPNFIGGSNTAAKMQAMRSAQYTFKSSLDKPAEEVKK